MGQTKHTVAPMDQDDLREEVRAWVAEFRRKNGVDPVRNQVATAIGRRANVLRALDWLDEIEATDRARLNALPDIPDTLRTQGSELVEKLWITAAEVSAPIIAELRRKLSDDAKLHRDQNKQNLDLLEGVEDELERERARADQAELAHEAAVAEIETLRGGLMAAQVKLDERESILLRFLSKDAASEADVKPTPKARAGKARDVAGEEPPETIDIPFGTEPSGKPTGDAPHIGAKQVPSK